MCANCIAANRLHRKTCRQFFVNKVIARSFRSEVSHGRYKGTNVHLFSCQPLQAKLIVLFITYSVSGSVDRNMAQLYSSQNHDVRETFIFTCIKFLDFTHLGFIDDNLQNRLKNQTLSTCSLVVFLCFLSWELNHFKYIFFSSVSSACQYFHCKSDCCILKIINQNRYCRYKLNQLLSTCS